MQSCSFLGNAVLPAIVNYWQHLLRFRLSFVNTKLFSAVAWLGIRSPANAAGVSPAHRETSSMHALSVSITDILCATRGPASRMPMQICTCVRAEVSKIHGH